jgi:hypothetical protein
MARGTKRNTTSTTAATAVSADATKNTKPAATKKIRKTHTMKETLKDSKAITGDKRKLPKDRPAKKEANKKV